MGLTLLWSVTFGIVNNAPLGYWPTLEDIVAFVLLSAKAGSVLGLIAVTIALLFGRVQDPSRFKLAMALCICAFPACFTLILLILTLTFSSDMSLSDAIRLLPLFSNLPFAYCFSQIVARKYLSDISPDKRKAKPAPGGA